MFADLMFYVFAGVLLLGALGVVTAKNPMYCVLFLILSFFNAAGLFVLLGAEFIGLLMIMVYVGAVAVMFLFVLMTINIDFALLKENTATSYLPVGVLIGMVLVLEIGMAIWGGLFNPSQAVATLPFDAGDENIITLGNVLFTNYLLPFQGVAMVLLVAMVGAIVLTHRQREGVKRQDVMEQLSRSREDSLSVVKVTTGEGVTSSYFKG